MPLQRALTHMKKWRRQACMMKVTLDRDRIHSDAKSS